MAWSGQVDAGRAAAVDLDSADDEDFAGIARLENVSPSLGKSRGGLTTKIAALVDALGNLVRFVLLPGQRHDITSFDVLMAGIACLALIGDKAFDAGWLRERLTSGGIEAVIPLREGTTGHPAHDAEKYKWRHLVENFFCAIKAFRRIATRYEKTDTCFAAMINIVAVVLWTR